LPAASDKGVLSADGLSCTYASGQVVTFASPVVLPLQMNPTWNFTITNQGRACLGVNGSPQSTFVVTTSGGTFTWATVGFGAQVTCPNGQGFSNTNVLALFGCEGGIAAFPGTEWSSTDTSVSFNLLSTTNGPTQVFDCAKQ
jgi:hypothetical protein